MSAPMPAGTATFRCKYCDQEISHNAMICHHCNRPQVWWKVQYSEFTALMGALTGLALMILGSCQLNEAHVTRVESDEALRNAKIALQQAKRIQTVMAKQAKLEQNVTRYAEGMFADLCVAMGGRFVLATQSCEKDGVALKYRAPFPLNRQ